MQKTYLVLFEIRLGYSLTCHYNFNPKGLWQNTYHRTFYSQILAEIPASEVNQFDFKSFCVDQKILQLNVTVDHFTATADVTGCCCLCQDKPCYVLNKGASTNLILW